MDTQASSQSYLVDENVFGCLQVCSDIHCLDKSIRTPKITVLKLKWIFSITYNSLNGQYWSVRILLSRECRICLVGFPRTENDSGVWCGMLQWISDH